ncbi:MAG: GIY-YIG nuclease family protein [Patescibacteria group bacterium]
MAVHRSPTPPFARGGAIPNIMFYVYILKSKKDKKLYIGYTGNLRSRYAEHKNGLVEATKNRRPIDIVYYEAYGKKESAQEREKQLKKFGSSYKGLIK